MVNSVFLLLIFLARIQSIDATDPDEHDEVCKIEFVVRSTADVPPGASIFLAGSLQSLGPWKPDGFLLTRFKDTNQWKGTFEAKKGDTLKYKFTCGTWDSVEKTVQGGDVPNRVLELGDDATIKITVAAWATAPASSSTVTGDIDILEIPIGSTSAARPVRVWLPSIYKTSNERYPVLYLLDGQNVFDSATAAFGVEWQADESAQSLISTNEIPPVIIVAVDNSSQRLKEYTRSEEGQRLVHLEWIIDVVKSEIDEKYRTLTDPANTTIGGSSLGGLFALNAFSTKANVFGNAICMSPSLFWDDERLLKKFENERLENNQSNRRLWLDFGTHESSDPARSAMHIERFSRLRKALESHDSEDFIALKAVVDEGAAHDEKAWARRFPMALQFIYDQKP